MDKEQVGHHAYNLFAGYEKPLPLPERIKGFIAVFARYGEPTSMMDNGSVQDSIVVSKEAAEGMLREMQTHPEKCGAIHEGTHFVLKRAWLEDENGKGRIMAEYVRKDA